MTGPRTCAPGLEYNMDIGTIINLANAGFTRAEIAAIAEHEKDQPAPEPKQEPKQDPKQEPKPEPAPEPKQEQTYTADDLMRELLGLKSAVYAGNINGAGMPEHTETAEDVLASIISPVQPAEDTKG